MRHAIGIATVPGLDSETCSRIARRALGDDRSVAGIVLEERPLTAAELDALLEIEAMTLPARLRLVRGPRNTLPQDLVRATARTGS